MNTVVGFLAGALMASAVLLFIQRTGNSVEIDDDENSVSGSVIAVQDSPVSKLSQADSGEADADNTARSINAQLLKALTERVELAEFRIEALEEQLVANEPELSFADQTSQESQPAIRQQLIDAGFDPFVVDQVETVRDYVQLQRLELRDQATREGWIDSDRFRDLMRDLRADTRLKESLGDEAFDQLLLAEGRSNRVRIDSVIAGSAADSSGVEIGDVIFRYADSRIFSFGDLRRATTAGERDEPVTLQVLRNEDAIDLIVPRGPLGVTVTGVTVAADG